MANPIQLSAFWSASLTLLMFVLTAVSCHGAEPKGQSKTVILSGQVNVTVTCDGLGEDPAVDPEENRYYECEIDVENNGRVFKSIVAISGARSDNDPVGHIRELTRWQNGYLFVPYDLGGNAWRGRGCHVFAVRNGEFISIGSVAGDQMYENGHFYDISIVLPFREIEVGS